jgi:hypothetical protein
VTPNEVAFLALGLVLGIASGAAGIVIAGTRRPTHEIRLTVAHDAIPRRASTLAADSVGGGSGGPAPGGPGDRRAIDRDQPDLRTLVRSPLHTEAAPQLGAVGAPVMASGAVAIAIEPEPDRLLAELAASGPPSLRLVLDGDHRAMLGLLDALAGPDAEARRAWEDALVALVEAVRERAIDLGMVDLPMGNPFWDTFTIDQCREIVVALASAGRRFDGRDGWADGLAPTYHDLSRALADCGIDPRRVRAWPNSAEIADLFRGARVAAGEAVARNAPTLEAEELRRFLAGRDAGLEPLWRAWDAVRRAVGADRGGAGADRGGAGADRGGAGADRGGAGTRAAEGAAAVEDLRGGGSPG